MNLTLNKKLTLDTRLNNTVIMMLTTKENETVQLLHTYNAILV